MKPLDEVLDKLIGRKMTGGQWSARCPAHADQNNSLSVTEAPNGDVLVHCHAGCSFFEVAAGLGMKPSEFFVPEEVDRDAPPTVYTYQDEEGNPLYHVTRTWDKHFSQRGVGQKDMKGVRRVPYHLPELLLTGPEDWIIYCEGEKDADNVRQKLGLPATTNVGGSSIAWDPAWTPFFAKKRVAIVPDNDEPGQKLAATVLAALTPVAAECVVVKLPGIDTKGDITDWIRMGGKREDLLKLIEAEREGMHPHVVLPIDLKGRVTRLYDTGLDHGVGIGIQGLDEIYRPTFGSWTVVSGTPGSGKSTWMDFIMVRRAQLHGWRWGVFSAENLPLELHMSSLAKVAAARPFDEPDKFSRDRRMSPLELEAAIQFIQRQFTFIEPQESGQTVDAILETCAWLVKHRGTNAFILDPWNELDHTRPRWMTEVEHIGAALQKIRRFTRNHNVHFTVVAHPTKLQRNKDGSWPTPTMHDINGGAMWNNRADFGIIVERDYKSGVTTIHNLKTRWRWTGKVGAVELEFNPATGHYSERPRDYDEWG